MAQENENAFEAALAIEKDLNVEKDDDDAKLFELSEENKKEMFLEELMKRRVKKDKLEVRTITKAELQFLIELLLSTDSELAKRSKDERQQYYYFRAKYGVNETVPPQLFYIEDGVKMSKTVLCLEEMFDACMKVHASIGYQGRAGMEKEGAKFFCNMTRPIIETFLKYSKDYQLKRRRTINHGMAFHPIRSDNFNSRMQIDLVGFQSLPDGEYKWVLNAQDHLTKYCHLRPLKDKTALAVAKELFDIFCQFGCPVILHSDNGREFKNQVVSSLKTFWPGIQLVYGGPRKPTTQGSVERANGDFQSMLGSWMRENKTTNWAFGLAIIQHQKNRKHHRGIGMSPFKAMFGHDAYNGLENVNVSDEQKTSISTAKELFALLGIYCRLTSYTLYFVFD